MKSAMHKICRDQEYRPKERWNQKLTLYNSSATRPLTRAVVVAMAGIIFPAINLLYQAKKKSTVISNLFSLHIWLNCFHAYDLFLPQKFWEDFKLLLREHFRINSILVPRGRAPFGQHQESRPLARSNDILVLNGFVNTIDYDQNQSDLSDLTPSMRRVTGSPWIADFRCWTRPGPGCSKSD